MRPSTAAAVLALALAAFYVGFRAGHSSSTGSEAVYGGAAEERFATILRIPEANARASALASFFSHANASDAEALVAVLNRERRHSDEVALVLFSSWLARIDPESALRQRVPAPYGGHQPWIQSVIREWTRKDPKAALAAVTALPREPWEPRQAAVRALVRAWFDVEGTDPNQLLDLLESMGENGEIVRIRGDAIDDMLLALIDARGADAAKRFVEDAPERHYGFRAELFGRLAGDLALQDPKLAYAWAQQYLDTPEGRNILLYLGSTWGYRNGPEAMEWALSLPPDERKEKTVERTWRSFLLRDREQAREWMRVRQPTPELESAFSVYLMGTANTDPEEAIRRAAEIRDPGKRNRVLVAAGQAWRKRAPDATQAWLDSGGLPEEVVRGVTTPHPRMARRRGAEPES